MKKRALSLILALVLVVGLLPMTAMADSGYEAEIVGGSKYATLPEAVKAAQDGDTVRVLRDIVIVIPEEYLNKRYYYTMIENKTLTIDLNGMTISWDEAAQAQTVDEWDVLFCLKNGADVTITGNGTVKGYVGKMNCCTSWLRNLDANDAPNKLTVKNGSFYGEMILYITNGGGEIFVEGGRFENDIAGDGYQQTLNVQGDLGFTDGKRITMTGGTLVGDDPRFVNDGNMVPEGYAVGKKIVNGKREYTVKQEWLAIEYTEEPVEDYDDNHTGNGKAQWKAKYGDFPETVSNATFMELFDEPASLAAILDDIPFVDVLATHYFYDSVKWAYHAGVTGGTGAWHFSPDDGCTRAQIVTFLWRAAGCPSATYLGNFTDVDANAYYATGVAWAVENGITNGTSATTFSPEAVCTRADAVTFLYRAFGRNPNYAANFSDVPANAYYADAVAWAAENGVTGGTGEGKFSPADTCSRAQIVTFLYRTLG